MKQKTKFFCTECGNETARWSGQCPACGAWNTLVEAPSRPKNENKVTAEANAAEAHRSRQSPEKLSELDTEEEIRFSTGVGELDRVLGGGAVRGSVVLVGGAPGVGKSTLLLQLCGLIGKTERVLYVSGEESRRQLKMRAQRLGVSDGDIYVLAETQVSEILSAAEDLQPTVVIIDSIQTMFDAEVSATPGSVSQVRESTMVFEMADNGLREVPNPSETLLSGRPINTPGTCVTCVMEGSRPILAEIQALVAQSGYGSARRNSNGIDYNRAMLLLAVLEKRGGMSVSGCDAYINVVGGLQLDEPAADLATLLAVASSYSDKPINSDVAAVGEVGLSAEVRSVQQLNLRLSEIARLGFGRCIIPAHIKGDVLQPDGLELIRVKNIREAIKAVL